MANTQGMSRGLVISWLLAAVVIVVGLVIGTVASSPPTPLERARNLAGQFACPQCDGESVRESNAGIAVEIRAEIQRQVQLGRTDSEILGYLDSKYPGRILTPPATGLSSLVWILPVTLGILALGGAGFAFLWWKPRQGVVVAPEDQELVDKLLSERREGSSSL